MFAWHVHHSTLYELLMEGGIARRTGYIQTGKPSRERPRRLRLLKAVQNQGLITALHAAVNAAHPNVALRRQIRAVIGALHREECKKCPWNGKTIFPQKVRKK